MRLIVCSTHVEVFELSAVRAAECELDMETPGSNKIFPDFSILRHGRAALRFGLCRRRAAEPGAQTIRLLFDEPQELRRISLVFEEDEMMRTQEFVMRWSSDPGGPFREIARQQWNFSAPE